MVWVSRLRKWSESRPRTPEFWLPDRRKARRVDHAVAVALKGVAIGVIEFRITPSAARFDGESKVVQHGRAGREEEHEGRAVISPGISALCCGRHCPDCARFFEQRFQQRAGFRWTEFWRSSERA